MFFLLHFFSFSLEMCGKLRNFAQLELKTITSKYLFLKLKK